MYSELETCFTRALFGLAPLPFLLGKVINCHLDAWEKEYPEVVSELQQSLYVDDLLTIGETLQHAHEQKGRVVKIFNKATFKLQKRNSDVKELEMEADLPDNKSKQSYAKQQLGVKPYESKMLGLKWDKTGHAHSPIS